MTNTLYIHDRIKNAYSTWITTRLRAQIPLLEVVHNSIKIPTAAEDILVKNETNMVSIERLILPNM